MVRSNLPEADASLPLGEWLFTHQAATLKGVTQTSVRRAIGHGVLPGFQCDGKVLVRRSDVEKWEPTRSNADRAKRAAAARWHREKGEADG